MSVLWNLPKHIQTFQTSEDYYVYSFLPFRHTLYRQMNALPGRQKSNKLCSPCVMNSTILFSKWRSHNQTLYLYHGKAGSFDSRGLHSVLSLQPSSATVQLPDIQACFQRCCAVCPCSGHFLMCNCANPNKPTVHISQPPVRVRQGVNIVATCIWELHDIICRKM